MLLRIVPSLLALFSLDIDSLPSGDTNYLNIYYSLLLYWSLDEFDPIIVIININHSLRLSIHNIL